MKKDILDLKKYGYWNSKFEIGYFFSIVVGI